MEFIERFPGEKRNKNNTLAVIDLNHCDPDIITDIKATCDNKSVVVAQEVIESAECVKVTDKEGNWLYFRTELFNYVKSHSEELYLTDDWMGTKILIGTLGKQIMMIAPLVTNSVEMYL